MYNHTNNERIDMNNNVILVDIFGNREKEIEKITAHKLGLLHEAFSLFIIKDKKMLLQKRVLNKYHSGGLWTNACCSHPQLNEDIKTNIKSKTFEELGATINKLKKEFSFVYRCVFDNGLIEYEYDNVYTAQLNSDIVINPNEVEKIKWVDLHKLALDLKKNPQNYTYWFLICAPKIINKYIEKRED